MVQFFLRLELDKAKKDLYSISKNAKVGLENQSVYPIHTNFTRLQVYFKSLTQYWAMANRLGNYTMTCYSERDLQSSKERGE